MTSDKISEARQTFLGCVYRNAQSSPCEIGRLFARKATDQKELTTEVVRLMESAFTVAMAESKDLRMQLAEEHLRADTAEAERDALRVHLAAGIAYVQRLVNCSKNQDSVATGYLSDILAALNQKSEGESQ